MLVRRVDSNKTKYINSTFMTKPMSEAGVLMKSGSVVHSSIVHSEERELMSILKKIHYDPSHFTSTQLMMR